MIKLFESYSIKINIEELSSAILQLSNDVFKDIKPKPFPVCSWIDLSICEFSLYYDSQTILYCRMEISKNMDDHPHRNPINLSDEYYAHDITFKLVWQYGFSSKFIEPFFNYLRYVVLTTTNIDVAKKKFSSSFINPIKKENVKDIISKLNKEDYELWLEASKYNL